MYEVKEAFKPKEGAQAKSGPEKARSFAGLSKASVQLAGFSLTLSLTESGHEGPSGHCQIGDQSAGRHKHALLLSTAAENTG